MDKLNSRVIPFLLFAFTLSNLPVLSGFTMQTVARAHISFRGEIVYSNYSRLCVYGNQIRLADGTPVVLKGVSVSGPDIDYNSPPAGGEWNRVKESYFDYCKSWGLNVVRLCISWDLLQPGFTGPLDVAYLSRMNEVVGWARARGIYVIIDLHYENHYPSGFGSFPPEWGTDFWYPYGSNTPTLRNEWIEMWRLLTEHYKGEDAIAFFGLCNEPHLPPEMGSSESQEFVQAWMSMANQASIAIHSIDPNRIVGIDPPSWSHAENMRLIEPVTDSNPNIIYTPHYYWEWNVAYTFNPQDIWDGQAVNHYSYIRPAIDWMNKYDKPILFTEFGNIDPNRPDLEQMCRDFLDISEQYKVGWVYWQFWRSDDYGLLRDPGFSGSSVENPMVAILKEYT